MHNASEHALAVLVDIENMARPGARNRGEFDIHLVMNRLAEKGRVVVKRAYADWSRYRDARRELMNAGLELIEMPSAREGAKNRADIKMAVDAMEIAYSRQHVDNFVIVSGDSDFTPLVGKLRELNKRVIGVGRDVSSASPLLIANCDEFFFYDSLASKALPNLGGGVGIRRDALSLLRETLMNRQREGDEHPQASAVKDSMRRRDPAFDEQEIGFSTFSKFLEDAQVKGVVRLHKDPRSGTFTVELTDTSAPAPTDWPSLGEERAPVEIGEGRRRRRRRRGEPSDTGAPSEAAEAASEPDEETGEAAEVFEFEVQPRKPAPAPLPPLDQPITYEDMLAADDAIDGDADDAEEAPPTRGSRRRSRPLATVSEPTAGDLDAEDATSPDSDDTAAAESTPSTRRRVRRGTVLPTLTGTDEDAAAAADDSGDDDEAKPRRRTRAPRSTATGEATAEATVDDAEADKPKRRARTKKVDETAGDEAVATPADGDADETPKPKRRPRTKKPEVTAESTETAVEATAEGTSDAPSDDAPAAPKRRVRRKASDADAPASDTGGVSPKQSPY